MLKFDTFFRYSFPMVKTYWPFVTGGLITVWSIKKAADAQAMTDEFINDPRNRIAQLQKKHEQH